MRDMDVLATPPPVVGRDDELNARMSRHKILHRSREVRRIGDGEVASSDSRIQQVSPSHVDGHADNIRGGEGGCGAGGGRKEGCGVSRRERGCRGEGEDGSKEGRGKSLQLSAERQ